MDKMMEAFKDLQMTADIQEDLNERGKLLLRNQAHAMYRALLQLKKRADLGHVMASKIWSAMVDTLTGHVNPNFFEDYKDHYFWSSEVELTVDEQVLKNILDLAIQRHLDQEAQAQAPEKARGKKKGKGKSKTAARGGHPHLCLFEGVTPLLHPFPVEEEEELEGAVGGEVEAKPTPSGPRYRKDGSELHPDSIMDEDLLMTLLASVIKIAIDNSEPSNWTWSKEDEELLGDIKVFNQGLKIAMQLVRMNIGSEQELYEMFHLYCHSCCCSFKYNGIHTKEDLDGFISRLEEYSSVANGVFTPEGPAGFTVEQLMYQHGVIPSMPGGSAAGSTVGDSDNTSEGAEGGLTCAGYDHGHGIDDLFLGKDDNDNSDEDEDDEGDEEDVLHEDQQYVVRHFTQEPGQKKRQPVTFKCTPCEHNGVDIPPAHARDMKKVGCWCTCGKKFLTCKELDRHLTYGAEALVLSCTKCDFKANRRCCMEHHKKELHDKAEPVKASRRLYKCTFKCGQVFASKKEMRDHQKETDRQCRSLNAKPLPLKNFPTDPETFLRMLKGDLDRANVALTPARLNLVLEAMKKDTARKLKEAKAMELRNHALEAQQMAKTGEDNNKPEQDQVKDKGQGPSKKKTGRK